MLDPQRLCDLKRQVSAVLFLLQMSTLVTFFLNTLKFKSLSASHARSCLPCSSSATPRGALTATSVKVTLVADFSGM